MYTFRRSKSSAVELCGYKSERTSLFSMTVPAIWKFLRTTFMKKMLHFFEVLVCYISYIPWNVQEKEKFFKKEKKRGKTRKISQK